MNEKVSSDMNPMGTDGFEFLEFSGPETEHVVKQIEMLGFTPVARHRTEDVTLYRQGDINFLVNNMKSDRVKTFSETHGPGASAMGFRVKDAKAAMQRAIDLGATAYEGEDYLTDTPAIYGIGDTLIYFVDRYQTKAVYDQDFEFIEGIDPNPKGVGLTYLDHVTHNVQRGNMDVWGGFYEKFFNFKEIRYFDIEGKLTGLLSRAMTSPCGNIRIPINESSDDKSQIEEFLKEFNGEGIQHIALAAADIYETVETLREQDARFLSTPDTYYEKVDERVPEHNEDLPRLKKNKILVDGAPVKGEGILLQIFTENLMGPVFFEIIQRKGNEGFGEGNFKALFESIEEDQIRRGVLEG